MWVEQDMGIYATPEKDYYAVWMTHDPEDGQGTFEIHRMDSAGCADGAILTRTDSLDDAAFAVKMDRGISNRFLLRFMGACIAALVAIAAWQLFVN